ncbi:hypothetical protein ACIBF7_22030 [Nonomuraea sp. NPDC050478]|uniref:hypothetical protein n=1 Tax=Nonomuraea sp. NPDC050478 TaxID=3364365 RepID=UPI00378AE914
MRYGVREFELTLMHRMRDVNAPRVERALRDLGATRAELRAAHAHWTRLAHAARAPKGLTALRSALGPPAHEGERPVGSLTCEVACWVLPSWPELEFEVLTGPGGAPHHWAADFRHDGATYRARFVYGLYQGKERVTR